MVQVSFRRQIAPLLRDRCVGCHREGRARGRYRLDTYETLQIAGASGEVPLVAGDADAGEWMRLIHTEDPEERMPQDADPLTPAEVELLRLWIEQGAAYDGGDPRESWAVWLRPEPIAPPETYPMPHPITAMAFTPDGRGLVVGGYHELLFWDVDTEALRGRLPGLPEQILELAWDGTGDWLAVAGGAPGRSGELLLVGRTDWAMTRNGGSDPDRKRNWADAVAIRSLWVERDVLTSVAWDPDGNRVLAGGTDGALRLFAKKDGLLTAEWAHHADWVLAVAFSQDGALFGTASRDRTARVCEGTTGEPQSSFTEHAAPVEAIVFHPDGSSVWSGGRDRRVRRWKVSDSGRQDLWQGFRGEVMHLRVGPDRLFAATRAGEVWSRAFEGNKEVTRIQQEGTAVSALAIHPERRLVAAGDFQGRIRIWAWDETTALREFVATPIENLGKPK